ncbi:hypothetical protein LtaPh_0304200 [Leishmania tarentolae]|uniref:Uncharacterized protein n=1 Tax=Leishmania tarentolae TaxID=5689 RepID=A0A640K7M5_LEITA|nr:hypothetical protein LtaPh_0304200 [Leishmania tarentolae]
MQASTGASWQRQEPRRTNSALSRSPQPWTSASLRSPPTSPQQYHNRHHPYPHPPQQQRRANGSPLQQQSMPHAGVPAPPPYSNLRGVASAGELATLHMYSPRMSSPLSSPFQHPKPHHRRYRSSLPAPPPLRSLMLSTDHSSLQLARAHSPRHQQRAHRTGRSSRFTKGHAPPLSIAALEESDTAGAAARQGSHAHNRQSTRGRSNVQLLHPSATVLSKDEGEDKTQPSTPVDQRIPAMVLPAYDVYNLDIPGAGMCEAAAAAARQGAYASSALISRAYHLKTAHPKSQLFHPLKLVDGVRCAAVPPQPQSPTSGPQVQHCTAPHPHYDSPTCHSPQNHSFDGGSGVGDGKAGSAEEASACPTRCHCATSSTYRMATTTAFTATGTPCGLSMSMCGGDWQSPCLAAANMRCHHHHYPQPLLTRTTPAFVVMRSNSVGVSDGLGMAPSPISTPARAPRTPQQRQPQQPCLPYSCSDAHHHCHAHSLSVPSLASAEVYAICEPCSTPHEAGLEAGLSSFAAPGAAVSVVGRDYQQALATPVRAREAVPNAMATAARWGFSNPAATSVSVATGAADVNHRAGRGTVGVMAGRGGAFAVHDDDDDDEAALLHASSSAYLRYQRNSDFLYAVDDADGCEAAASPRTGGATALGDAFMLAAAQATADMDSPVTVSRSASLCSPGASSVYYSPQQFRIGDLQPSTPATATTTPALRMYPPHNSVLHGRPGTHTASSPSHVGCGRVFHSCATVTPLQRSCLDAAGSAGPNVLMTPPNARCSAPTTGDVWRSPMQWNPRQARDDLEMEAVKHVAQFALTQVAATAAPAAGSSSTPLSPSFAAMSVKTVAHEVAAALSPSHVRDASHAEARHDGSVSLDTVALDGEEEEAAGEWLELLLHYRDRENESGRIRRALVDAATAAQAPGEDTGGTSNPSTPVTAATTLSWWVTSSLMRDGFPLRSDECAPQQQRQGRRRHHAGARSARSSPLMTTATRAALAPPPAQLCAAMSAHKAAGTISRCVRHNVWRMRENERRRVSASVAARVAAR